MEYPVQANRWRTRALVLAVVATCELLVLVALGTVAAGRMLAGQVETVARARELPARRTPPATAPDRPLLERSETSVAVLNGNGVSGAAGASAAKIRALAYVISGVGNAPRRDVARSIVMYRKGYQPEASRLAKDLRVNSSGRSTASASGS